MHMTFNNGEIQQILKAHVAKTFGIPPASVLGDVAFEFADKNGGGKSLSSATVAVDSPNGIPKGISKDDDVSLRPR